MQIFHQIERDGVIDDAGVGQLEGVVYELSSVGHGDLPGIAPELLDQQLPIESVVGDSVKT